ncbi:Xylose isomerase-like TIM barrel [uncultured archaeon]|nr:Xylose isomerase-like TIM barrel [uncultured archaeon]
MAGYENLYEGSPSYLVPRETGLKYISAGYQSPLASIGMATDPRTANQLGELNLKLNPGAKHMEVGAIQGAVMESIPDQHLDEMRRVAKQAGVSLSMHAPIVEPSGMGEREWSEVNRIGAERQLESALLRAHKLNPTGNISVTTHSAAGPELVEKHKEKNEKGEMEEKTTSLYVVDPESGRISPYPVQKRFFPEEGKEGGDYKAGEARKFELKEELKKINEDQWKQKLTEINRLATYGEERLDAIGKQIPKEIYPDLLKGNVDIDKVAASERDRDIYKQAQREVIHSQIYLRDAYRNLKNTFDETYLSASEEDKKKLDKFAQEIKGSIKPGIETDPGALGEVLEKGLKVLGEIKTPEKWKPLREFAMEKSAETFANVASSAYKKFGDTAPILNIENPPAGSGFSRAEDLKELIEKTRDKLAENLKKEGLSSGEAQRQAEKLVGATWDVGHINMLRKKGYSEQDVVKQTEIIAPFVNHVHLSDNFGLDHTELPMGMGNVPMKEIMKKLGDKGFEAKKIIEAGNWWQYFGEKGGGNPFKPSIEAFDSPVYSMEGGPYWSQMGGYGMYYSGHGAVNPAVHHRLYGSGFENLPIELGGEIGGDRGRFSGTPNQ